MATGSEDFHQGQRWISESEPELGLGSISGISTRTVSAVFEASGSKREYSRRNAPLRRVRFRVGDVVRDKNERALKVKAVSEKDGLLYYEIEGARKKLPETELSPSIVFNKPEERLFAGQLDYTHSFDLRVAALEHRHRRRQSPVRGFTGGRIDLIPHQLYIASEVSSRLAPRVLLADEVGLGKTIEACLILHRLILTGRVQRAIIMVPDSLVHQWFIELLRRFNLWFHIFDEERCSAIEAADSKTNPFLDDQFILCSIHLCAGNEVRTRQAIEAGWDMLVVDEAHHLGWSPEAASPEYQVVEALGKSVPGLLLLTATPEQLGMMSHFARLRLLDPHRFYDFDQFLKEADGYIEIAQQAEDLTDAKELEALLDRHGTGRVRFRNTRATIAGFPERRVHMHPLQPEKTKKDPRIDWLAQVLRETDQKILLICRTPEMVSAIEAGLRLRLKNAKVAMFHEDLTLVQRDRNAAWFAEKNGASILLCSEIGSEGRNFQFAHHLVLFDLPLDPELLEQRIGRLDRIGQTEEIQIHVPFVSNSFQEVLARWYHDGLDAFERYLSGGHDLLERFGKQVHAVASFTDLQTLLLQTQEARTEIAERLLTGRDRLLELHSFRPEVAEELVNMIRAQDNDRSLDDFMVAVFDQYSIPVEDIAPRTYRVGSAGALTDSFPGLPADGFTITADRKRALVREDIQFLTWDHPLVTNALDLLLGSEKGNSSFAFWPDRKISGLYLETIYVLECVASPKLHIDRFLPPTPIRIMIDRKGETVAPPNQPLKDGDGSIFLDSPEVREEILPPLLAKTAEMANAQIPAIIRKAKATVSRQLEGEIERLEELKKVNPSVRSDEITLLRDQRKELDRRLSAAHIRLDAIRLIHRGKEPI